MRISNTKVGSIGQNFVEKLCEEMHMPCEFPLNVRGRRSKQSPWDTKISEIEFELKTATEDVNNNFQFNHIRYHRPYDALICIGISPEDIFYGVWSKADVTTGQAGQLVSMERKANTSYKLTKRASDLVDLLTFQAKLSEVITNVAVQKTKTKH